MQGVLRNVLTVGAVGSATQFTHMYILPILTSEGTYIFAVKDNMNYFQTSL